MKSKLPFQIMLMLGSLYAAQTLAVVFLTMGLISALRENGASLETISMIYSIGLFWAFRFLWSTLIDKAVAHKQGQYKSILVTTQLSCVILLITLGFFNIVDDLFIVLILGCLITIIAATQDTATDGLSYKLAEKNERGKVNSYKISGFLIGHILGGGISLIIYHYYGWQNTLLFIVLCNLLPIILLFFFKEPTNLLNPITNEKSIRVMLSFWKSNNRMDWLILIILYGITTSLASRLIFPLLIDQGWSTKSIGLYINIPSTFIGILGAVIAGYVIGKVERKKILLYILPIQTIINFLFVISFYGTGNNNEIGILSPITIVWLLFCMAHSMSGTVFSTIMMDEVQNKNYPATEMSMQNSVYFTIGIVAGGLGTYLAGKVGYQNVFLLSVLFAIITFLFLFKYYRKRVY